VLRQQRTIRNAVKVDLLEAQSQAQGFDIGGVFQAVVGGKVNVF